MIEAFLRRALARLAARISEGRKIAARRAKALSDRIDAIATRIRERAQAQPQRDREGLLIQNATFGAQCAALVNNEVFRTFSARMEAQLIDAFLACEHDDDLGRFRLQVAIKAQRQWTDFVLGSAEAGRAALAELERLSTGKERKLRSVMG